MGLGNACIDWMRPKQLRPCILIQTYDCFVVRFTVGGQMHSDCWRNRRHHERRKAAVGWKSWCYFVMVVQLTHGLCMAELFNIQLTGPLRVLTWEIVVDLSNGFLTVVLRPIKLCEHRTKCRHVEILVSDDMAAVRLHDFVRRSPEPSDFFFQNSIHTTAVRQRQ